MGVPAMTTTNMQAGVGDPMRANAPSARPLSDGAIEATFRNAGAYLASSRTVSIRLPLLENREDDRVEVGYNGKMMLLKRGETIDNLPEPLLDVLRHAELI